MLQINQSLPFGSSEFDNSSGDSFWKDESAGKAMLFSVLGLLSLTIFCINSFVLYLISTRRSLLTTTNVCLASLSCSDLLAGMLAIPLVISCNTQETDYNGVCLAMDLFGKFQSISTVLHLLVISLERYITIVQRRKIDGVVRMTSIVKVLCALWVFSLTVTLIQFAWVDSEHWQPNHNAEIIYDICLCVLVLVPLLVMLFVYGCVFYTLKKQNHHIIRHTPHTELTKLSRRRRDKELRAVVILSSMIITFITGWCGSFLLSLENEVNLIIIPLWLDYIFFFARYLTAIINPLLYTFVKLDFSEAALTVLHRWKSGKFSNRDRFSRAISI